METKGKLIKGLFFGLVISLLSGCEPQPADTNMISTDVINVPATASGKQLPGSSPVMTFSSETHDFGMITQGEKVSYAFTFKNTGGSDLVISSAQGSCGCTVPSYPKTAIKPGQSSEVNVVFDSEGKSGKVQ